MPPLNTSPDMKHFIPCFALALFAMLASIRSGAQIISMEQSQELTTDSPEVMPEFPGGEAGLRRYLRENLQYPGHGEERRIQGTVTVIGIIETDGSMDRVAVLRGIHPDADEEAARLVRAMPRWKPGTVQGRPVRTLMKILVTFEL